MWLSLAVVLLAGILVPPARAVCAPEPVLQDTDEEVTVLAQNLKFIATGGRRAERARLLEQWLDDAGRDTDLLLLSEARITAPFEGWQDRWCFYTQAGDGVRDGYRWAPLGAGRSPGGLAMAVRQRSEGVRRSIGGLAGRRYLARPVSFAEGLLGRLVNYRKGWAGFVVDGTHIVWSHTQASYERRPHRGAGRRGPEPEDGEGRAGQFAELARDLGRPKQATLLTGDLNLLAGFRPRDGAAEERVRPAREIDDRTLAWFADVTGLDFDRLKPDGGTFAGSVDKRDPADRWDAGAPYDRVGVNAAFLERHAGTRVSAVEIAGERFRLSDHLGIRISIPFHDPS